MWKARPIVAGVGSGLAEQVLTGESGLLVDPTDLAALGAAVRRLLDEPVYAQRLGAAAHRRAQELHLADRHLQRWADLLAGLVHRRPVAPAPTAGG